MKALVTTPASREVSKGRLRTSGQETNLHPDQFAFPSFELNGGIRHWWESSRTTFLVTMPSSALLRIKAMLEMLDERHGFAVVGPSDRFRQNRIIDGFSNGNWTHIFSSRWLWNELSLGNLEMKLAHAVKVSLSLLFAPVYLAFSRLGPVALTQTLRFNDLGATTDIAVPTLVLDIIMLTHCSVTLSTALSYSLDFCFMLHSRRRRDAVTCFSGNNKNRQEALP